ncbi:hypothetical protein ABZ682_18995 [Streptomyces griseoviridis]|uniref:hypothetical protein n=1 Tax=Streptomyces griseoviridis TaxID=45398 RepID=UPI0033C67730
MGNDQPRSDGAPEDSAATSGAGTGPDSDATPTRSTWARLRAIAWTQHLTAVGLAVGAVAAIAGLWFQAVATYWSQQTAKDQLEQSREDDERDRQEQAARVNFWEVVSGADGNSGTFHVINRSPDPVGNVVVMVAASTGDTVPAWFLTIGTMQPCSQYVYSLKDLSLHPLRNDGEKDRTLRIEYGASLEGVYFRDRNGQNWKRDTKGLVSRESDNLADAPEVMGTIQAKDKKIRVSADCYGIVK